MQPNPAAENWRRLKDRLATVFITSGGILVLLSILLILFFLVYEVTPLASPVNAEKQNSVVLQKPPERSLFMAVSDQGEKSFLLDSQGRTGTWDSSTGELVDEQWLDLGGDEIVALAHGGTESNRLALATRDGEVLLVDYYFGSEIARQVYSDTPIGFSDHDSYLVGLAYGETDQGLVLAGQFANGRLAFHVYEKVQDFFSGGIKLQETRQHQMSAQEPVGSLFIDANLRWLYLLLDDGSINSWRIDGAADADARRRSSLLDVDEQVNTSALLLGGISLLVAPSSGGLVQYFPTQGSSDELLQVRRFDAGSQVVSDILVEQRRKVLAAISEEGSVYLYNTTAERELLQQRIDDAPLLQAALSPRGDALAYLTADYRLVTWSIHNPHPEVSFSALWSEVWYESYPEPAYVWQSSASNNSFEPKYSFMPLAFGTLKAAFYTMCLAAPLAICGAIYTAQFMSARLRRKIKPLVELMEALPTVIIGFLAGLWLAPYVEANLAGVFALLVMVPIGVLVWAWVWSRLPVSVRTVLPEGWHAIVLIPVIICLGYLSLGLSDSIEQWFFGGEMRLWLTQELGISYDQRNSLIVGMAMGLAVIPTIFSIAEDAIFNVPTHLTDGSLALGATPWQTLTRVVLPTASPGIFTGLMIGLGRAVGETMIVLMATGNTPIMDMNVFEGMRTFAANLAVEMPKAEVDSTHYRLLFLTSLVLFMFTFVVNTIAELVRQQLRQKYSSL